ncbi:MAG TPA: DUF2779 domain-containing protein [Candidatus Eisenbacteria bacterium]|jgi:hypothetical protein|nr:DUF2779 domain-containing protein [Candidatus Eisenbacteria bacterium]
MSQLPLWHGALGQRASLRPLSKSKIAAGYQCAKRLYLEAHHLAERDPLEPGRQAILDAGRRVGLVARRRYPSGVRIEEDPRYHDRAVAETRAALEDPRVDVIYEAAFISDDIRVRVDILARTGDAWDIVEVKSSTGFKEEYVVDLATQVHVVEGSGLRVGRAMLLHVNSRYLWPGGPYDVNALFSLLDLSREARAQIPRLLERVARMREVLRSLEEPAVSIGPHCRKPYRCPYYGHCHTGMSPHHISLLPRLTPRIYQGLVHAGVLDIREIPEEFEGLNELQVRVHRAAKSGLPFTHPDLHAQLGAIRYPVHFLDFETCNPALPVIPGTHPFQQVPFQWSDIVLEADGALRHREYLHTDRTDPRPPLARALVEALEAGGSIVVYSGFEGRVIRGLAGEIPELAPRLLPLTDRLVDLHRLILDGYYHPEFHGSFSIKNVLPVLADGLGYDDLAIREGSQAALAFISMTDPDVPASDRAQLREGLSAYCKRDTEAMLRLFQVLTKERP